MGPEFEFSGEIWLHDGPAAWCFLTLPPELAEEIEFLAGEISRPFGSIRVEARIGDVSWSTSIFKDKKRGSYLLPVKSAVRKKSGIDVGEKVACSVTPDFD